MGLSAGEEREGQLEYKKKGSILRGCRLQTSSTAWHHYFGKKFQVPDWRN